MKVIVTGLAFMLLATCVVVAQSSGTRIDPQKIIDLTYAFDADTIYWPTATPFRWEKESWGQTPKGYFYAAAKYGASEHGGTHMDSPIHFSEGKATVDEIPVQQLIGAAYVIDISAQCAKNPDYRLMAADIERFEKTQGAIPAKSLVFVRTGWGRFWPDRKRYLGSDTPRDTSNLHFPGISEEAAKVLVARKIAAVGIDTASMDYGPSTDFIAHRVINGANIYGLENVANLDKLPAKGATVIALPMKIKGGSGAPVRIIAQLP